MRRFKNIMCKELKKILKERKKELVKMSPKDF
jgi:hypothetical protein